MLNDQGFISVISLLIMSILLISTLSLAYVSKLEYSILNSSKNNIQTYYAAEGKIQMVLNEKKYYNQILSAIELYIKLGRSISDKIVMDNEDIIEGDRIGNVKLRFLIENNRKILELESSSSYNKITKKLIAKLTILNDFFEMGIPIISENSIGNDRVEEYNDYMNRIQQEIKIPDQHKDIMGVDACDYDSIKIIKALDGKINIEFFRNNIENPIKRQVSDSGCIILIAKNKELEPVTLSILSENNSEEVDLEGVLYIEGNFGIHNNSQMKGIVIVNKGSIIVDPSIEFKVEGIVLLKNYIGKEVGNNDNIEINYDEKVIKTYGIYLPGFIEPKMKLIKSI